MISNKTGAPSASPLPSDAKARKNRPLYSGLIRYFPDALVAVAELSRIGNDQHNPGEPLHWAREKSTDELDALARHLFEAGTFDTDLVRHSTKLAWRALANLQKELERARDTVAVLRGAAALGDYARVPQESVNPGTPAPASHYDKYGNSRPPAGGYAPRDHLGGERG